MKPRHHAREVALQILYRYDLSAPDAGALIGELGVHFDHFQVPHELREFAGQLVSGTLREQGELDAMLESHASNWKVARMDAVDRSLLRMAVFELRHFPETDAAVVIDEAIELGKQFGTADTPAFVNGILDSVRNAVKGSISPLARAEE